MASFIHLFLFFLVNTRSNLQVKNVLYYLGHDIVTPKKFTHLQRVKNYVSHKFSIIIIFCIKKRIKKFLFYDFTFKSFLIQLLLGNLSIGKSFGNEGEYS